MPADAPQCNGEIWSGSGTSNSAEGQICAEFSIICNGRGSSKGMPADMPRCSSSLDVEASGCPWHPPVSTADSSILLPHSRARLITLRVTSMPAGQWGSHYNECKGLHPA